MNPAEELAAAAETLRNLIRRPELAAAVDLPYTEPLAEWLEHEANVARNAHLFTDPEPCLWCGEPGNAHALAVARQILGGGQP